MKAASLIVAVAGLIAALSLTGCGSRMPLAARPGMEPVPVARGAEKPATPAELIQPDMQSRPDRSAEPLKRSQRREDDPFDLPPS